MAVALREERATFVAMMMNNFILSSVRDDEGVHQVCESESFIFAGRRVTKFSEEIL